MKHCDGCACLRIERPANAYGVWLAQCTDPEKPAWLGERRTVATAPASWASGPFGIPRPRWCRAKKEAATVAETP